MWTPAWSSFGESLIRDSLRRVTVGDMRVLTGALGGLPLAIHLATGYINRGFSVNKFLDLLRERGLSVEPFAPNDSSYKQRVERALRATLELSVQYLEQELRGDAGAQLTALFSLGLGPAAGFGEDLATAIMGLPDTSSMELLTRAEALSLIERVPAAERPDGAWRVHPLLAEYFRSRLSDEQKEAATERLSEWFLQRVADDEENRARRWEAVEQEWRGLEEWLTNLGPGAAGQAASEGFDFASAHGPYHLWLAVTRRGLGSDSGEDQYSRLSWVEGNLALRVGELDLALDCAERKQEWERKRGHERETALAWGLKADILQSRGELDEALRIRREEELPVYEKLGDVRSRAVTMGQIADILQSRGELDEALRIRREEELPVYEKLGDVRCGPSRWVRLRTFSSPVASLMRPFASAGRKSSRFTRSLGSAIGPSRWVRLRTFSSPVASLMRPFASAGRKSSRFTRSLV